jgi:hypothetical protein
MNLNGNISTPFLKRRGNSFSLHINLSLKMGINVLFVATHMDQNEHGNWALVNTYTIPAMFNNANGGKEEMFTMWGPIPLSFIFTIYP